MGRSLTSTIVRASAIGALMVFLDIGSLAAQQNHCGAIAFSQSTGRLGWSYDFADRGAAENAAQAECAKGASDCKVPIWFCNACGAIATTSDLGWGVAWDANKEVASSKAVDTCLQYNPGKDCTVKRWVCTTR